MDSEHVSAVNGLPQKDVGTKEHNIIHLLIQALQLHCFKVLAFSTISFHLTRSCVHFVEMFIPIILKSPIISLSHLISGIPANLLDIGFQ